MKVYFKGRKGIQYNGKALVIELGNCFFLYFLFLFKLISKFLFQILR